MRNPTLKLGRASGEIGYGPASVLPRSLFLGQERDEFRHHAEPRGQLGFVAVFQQLAQAHDRVPAGARTMPPDQRAGDFVTDIRFNDKHTPTMHSFLKSGTEAAAPNVTLLQ